MTGTKHSSDSEAAKKQQKQHKNIELAKLRKRIADMEIQRNPLIPTWEQIAKYITPGRGIFDVQEPNKGERKDMEFPASVPNIPSSASTFSSPPAACACAIWLTPAAP